MSYRLVWCIRRVLTTNQASLVLPKPTCFCLNGNKFAFLTNQRRLVGCQRSENTKPKKSSVYTRTGDKGTSMLFNGERRPKNDDIFNALGTVDELSSCIGIANHYCKKVGNGLESKLIEIQCKLIEVGSNIATPRSSSHASKLSITTFDEENVKILESWIDTFDDQLPSLKHFILPSGGESSVFLHQCRSVCRRAERVIVPLLEAESAEVTVGKYINRLSDFFFVAARFAAKFENQIENFYQQRREDRSSNLVAREL
ncbi:17913_t:CDS:2, partial [Funneliformis geosporum]